MENAASPVCNGDEKKNVRTKKRYMDDVQSYIELIYDLKYPCTKNWNHGKHIGCSASANHLLPAFSYMAKPASLIPTKFVWSGICKVRSPIFTCKWLRDAVHLITGSSNGDLSLWNPVKYIQEICFSGHDSAVRGITVSNDGNWVVTADHNGEIKYWQPNLNFLHMFLAHTDPIRDLCFSPTDYKIASCGDDGLVKIWDFDSSKCECSLQGHGTDVKCLDWHPHKGVIVSGSKDCQQPVMLWDPRCSAALCTIHMHKSAVMSIRWNCSGNLFASASKDKTVKLFDVRAMKEFQVLRGHKKEVYDVAWHSVSEKFLSSGGVDGSLYHWAVGEDRELGFIETAHDGVVWELAWHPEGGMFASTSNDQSVKIWTRPDLPDISDHLRVASSSHGIFSLDLDQKAPTDVERAQFPHLTLMDTPSHVEQLQPCSKSKADGENSVVYPQNPLFNCVVLGNYSNPTEDVQVTKYPIGRAPVAKIPTQQDIDEDHLYLYDAKIPVRQLSPLQYENLYDEEEDCPMVIFPEMGRDINYVDSNDVKRLMTCGYDAEMSPTRYNNYSTQPSRQFKNRQSHLQPVTALQRTGEPIRNSRVFSGKRKKSRSSDERKRIARQARRK